MLKHEILSILTVDQWAGFKKYASERPQPEIVTSEGVRHVDYLGKDLYDYMVVTRIL